VDIPIGTSSFEPVTRVLADNKLALNAGYLAQFLLPWARLASRAAIMAR
jgi:hypothetical protein